MGRESRIPKPVVVDFDDYGDFSIDKLEYVKMLKELNPAFRCTLFTIPQRCSDAAIAEARKLDYVALAPHGWRHGFAECLSWTRDEFADKVGRAAARGIDAPVFRAPGWLINPECYYGAVAANVAIADHKDYRCLGSGARVYTYNKPLRNPPFIRAHGHLPNVTGNGIAENLHEFHFPDATDFRFVHEVADVDATHDATGSGGGGLNNAV